MEHAPLTLGLYIHWPFCVSKCPYCDFNSFVGKSIDTDAYLKAYLAQMEHYYTRTPHHQLRTIFFGGGTPSLMPPHLARAMIEHAQALWTCDSAIEITLEANPNTVDRDKFQAFKNAGINRLSIGIQSFNADDLKFLGRNHSADEGVRAIEAACTIYERVTFDLIYARPHQTLKQWEDELTYALSFGTKHLSLYQLTIEPGTAFAPRYERGEIILPKDELSADLYTLTRDITADHGLLNYEVSNYAHAGQESQHNLIYWRYQDYVGIGPGAHGRFKEHRQKIATIQHKAPELWVNQVEAGGHGREEVIANAQQIQEMLMMGLRLEEGVLACDMRAYAPKITALIHEGYMHKKSGRIALTGEGRLRLNSVLGFLCGD